MGYGAAWSISGTTSHQQLVADRPLSNPRDKNPAGKCKWRRHPDSNRGITLLQVAGPHRRIDRCRERRNRPREWPVLGRVILDSNWARKVPPWNPKRGPFSISRPSIWI